MTEFLWDGGLKLTVFKKYRSSVHYRCLACKSTRVTEYLLETDFGRRNKIRCSKCKKQYISSPGQPYDSLDKFFEVIDASEVEHVEIKKKKSAIIDNDNQLAPIEINDIWAANKYCKWNRCALCQSELTPAIIKPYKDFIKAHYNIECPNHGLLIKGGAVSLMKVRSIEADTMIRETIDRAGGDPTKVFNNDRILEDLGF